jgi:hypothetical protein
MPSVIYDFRFVIASEAKQTILDFCLRAIRQQNQRSKVKNKEGVSKIKNKSKKVKGFKMLINKY